MTIAILAAIGAGVGAFFWRRNATAAGTYFTEPVEHGPIRNVVNATGTVEAGLTVQVGSQITGQIQALSPDFHSTVKRGQLLART